MSLKNKIRLYCGVGMLIMSAICPLFGFWIAMLDWPTSFKAAVIGLLTAGIPELLAVAAAVILGKENFERIKNKFFDVLKRLRPTARVGKLRYTVGLIMFLLPIVPTYIMGYAPKWLPDSSSLRLYVNIAADCMFVTGLFVLGGDFWDKLRALFVYEAKAMFPEKSDGVSL
jgi:hypothetical protein